MPYQCIACGKSFIERANLRVHFKTHERDGISRTVLERSFLLAKQKLHNKKTLMNKQEIVRPEMVREAGSVRLSTIQFNSHYRDKKNFIDEVDKQALGSILQQKPDTSPLTTVPGMNQTMLMSQLPLKKGDKELLVPLHSLVSNVGAHI